jgi:hypothetical protein
LLARDSRAIVSSIERRDLHRGQQDQLIKSYSADSRFVESFRKPDKVGGEYQTILDIPDEERPLWGFPIFKGRISIPLHFEQSSTNFPVRSQERSRILAEEASLQIDSQDHFYSLTQVFDPTSATSWHEAARLERGSGDGTNLEKLCSLRGGLDRQDPKTHPEGPPGRKRRCQDILGSISSGL